MKLDDPLMNSPKMLKAVKKPYKRPNKVWGGHPINELRKKAGVRPFYKDKK